VLARGRFTRAAAVVTAMVVVGLAAVLAALIATAPSAAAAVSSRVVGMASAPDGRGYLVIEADGTAHSYGSVPDLGDQAGRGLAAPLVGGAVTPTGRGYWLFAADGGVFTHGDARFLGSAGNLPLVAPVVGGAPTPSGRGYWLFAADGGVFTYGDARFFGSAGNLPLVAPVVGGAPTPSGRGYWLTASDGGVFTYGDARFFGSAGNLALVRPVIGIDATRTGRGYRLFASDGGEFDYGDARFISSVANRGVLFSAFAVRPADDGHWLMTPDGHLQQSGLAPRLGAPAPGPPTVPPPAPPLGQVRTRLVPIADFVGPIAVRPRPGEPAAVLYVAERRGRIVRLDRGSGARSQVLDIQQLTTGEGERGLLGFDFAPSGGLLYVVYTRTSDGFVVVAEYRMSGATALPGTRRQLLIIDQPFPNHNGGDLHVTTDGLLWLSSGDGGSGGDPQENAQNLGTLLGKLIRIDPRDPPGSAAYGIPPTNPFRTTPEARAEIWAYGLRNPWRISFDPVTGDLWIGDVGQGSFEEIDYQPAGVGGRNYGWSRFEGNSLFDPNRAAPGAVGPIHTYSHAQGCSVTGGPVYRGTAIGGLVGTYLFADFCSGTIWGLRHQGGVATEVRPLDASATSIVELATDARGEVVVVSLAGTIYQLVAG